MKHTTLAALCLLGSTLSAQALAAPSGPDDRQVTEPRSVTSASNANVGRLNDIEKQVTIASQLDDVRIIKTKLALI